MSKKREIAPNPVQLAAGNVGGKAALGRLLGISRAAVNAWDARNEIPLARIPEVERVTGIPREVLRPDYFVT